MEHYICHVDQAAQCRDHAYNSMMRRATRAAEVFASIAGGHASTGYSAEFLDCFDCLLTRQLIQPAICLVHAPDFLSSTCVVKTRKLIASRSWQLAQTCSDHGSHAVHVLVAMPRRPVMSGLHRACTAAAGRPCPGTAVTSVAQFLVVRRQLLTAAHLGQALHEHGTPSNALQPVTAFAVNIAKHASRARHLQLTPVGLNHRYTLDTNHTARCWHGSCVQARHP